MHGLKLSLYNCLPHGVVGGLEASMNEHIALGCSESEKQELGKMGSWFRCWVMLRAREAEKS